MKITFKGVPGEQHDTIHMYGQDFPLGKAVKVTNPAAIRRLQNHPHFSATEDATDQVEDAKVKHEFTAAANAALAPIEEAHVPEPKAPAPTPAPTPKPAVLRSALEWQEANEKAPVGESVAMPAVVKSAAEYQDLEMKGAVNGNADATRNADSAQAENSRSAGNRGTRGSGKGK